MLLRQSLAKTQKSSLRAGYNFSSNALNLFKAKAADNHLSAAFRFFWNIILVAQLPL